MVYHCNRRQTHMDKKWFPLELWSPWEVVKFANTHQLVTGELLVLHSGVDIGGHYRTRIMYYAEKELV